MRVTFIIIIVFSLLQSQAQNLVPNCGFEEVYECPEPNDLMESCVGWISSRASSDHYHACASSGCIQTPAGVCFGYQIPLDGEGFGAYTSMRTVESEYKEHMAVELNEPLEVGTEYFLSFNVVRSNKEHFALATNNQGALFTTYLIDDDNDNKTPIPNFAHINNEEIITDTLNWIQIKGSFIADSAYAYMALGNFFDDSNTDTLHLGPEIEEAYYAVDVVRLSSDSLFAFHGISTPVGDYFNEHDQLKIFPNPAHSQVHIKSRKPIQAVQLFNANGKIDIPIRPETLNELIVELTDVSPGIYIVICFLKNGQTVSSHLVKK